MQTQTPTHMDTYTLADTHTHTHAHTHTLTHTLTHTHTADTRLHARTHTHTHTYAQRHSEGNICVQMKDSKDSTDLMDSNFVGKSAIFDLLLSYCLLM